MIILLVLLPALAVSQEQSVIRWEKCSNSENMCFCLGNGPDLMEYEYEAAKHDEMKKCEKVGLQNKFFSEDIALFQMQVMGEDTNQLGQEPELMVYHQLGTGNVQKSEKKLFGCKKLKDGKIVLIGNEETLKKYKISLFDDQTRSRFKQGIVVCAILTKRATQLRKALNGGDKTLLMLNTKEYSFATSHIRFFKTRDVNEAIQCNSFSFQDQTVSNTYVFRPLLNRDQKILNCDEYNTEKNLYTMRYEKVDSSGVEGEMLHLECKDENSDFNFYINRTNSTNHSVKEKILDPESYRFSCAAKIDEVCETPIEGCSEHDPLCPVHKPGSRGVASTLTCTGNKWLINNRYYDLTATCKKDVSESANSARFYANLPSGGYLPIGKDARCFTDYDCKLKSILDFPVEGRHDVDSLIDISDGVMKCANESKTLTIFHAETNVIMNTSASYTCDKVDGFWKNGKDVILSNSRVRCKDITTAPSRQVEEANLSENQVVMIIIGSVILFLVILAVIAVLWTCIRKHRSKIKIKKLLLNKKMEKADIISECKEDFGIFLRATPSNPTLIIEGLKKIDLLLREEMAEVEAWEEAYKFLMRFHAAIRRIDWPIRYMFSRYLYLRAKKIIDKHGWSTKEKIRNKKRDGLIRTVAIQLLSFSWDDQTSPESEDLILAGFRELGFRGLSQYPHCGMLWSIIAHLRPATFEHKSDMRRATFNETAFNDTLKKLADGTINMRIAPESIIPEFGSVAQQAAFALGASPNLKHLLAETRNVVLGPKSSENGGAVPKSYFKGMYKSLYRTPIQPILECFALVEKPKPPKEGQQRLPTTLEKLAGVAPASEWNELAKEAARISTYYGRHIDTKMLYNRFMPNGPSPDFVPMQLEQKLFEDAIEKAKEDIRAWFAAHTDRAEWKKKPNYSGTPKGEIGVFSTPRNACTPADSKKTTPASEGKGAIGVFASSKNPADSKIVAETSAIAKSSSSSNSKNPGDPAAAAAAAAAH